MHSGSFRRLSMLRRREEGQSIVEFALVIPVLALLLLGIMEGGRIFTAYVELQHVARDAARFASLNCTSLAVRDDQIGGWVASTLIPHLSGRTSTLDPGAIVVDFDRITSGTETWVEVALEYPLVIVTPVVSDLTGNPLTLQSRMVMRSE
ncbi:MAG: TadE/TadG family type IV pilus assembly protein [Bacillota bacterium]